MKASAGRTKSSGRRMAAQYVTTRVMAESATAAEGIPKILQALCESLGWDHGGVWSIDPQLNALRWVASWHVPAAEFSKFDALSRQTVFPPGAGLPGRVWSAREPVWVADTASDTGLPRAVIASKEGIHSAVGFPIILAGEILGVIELFSRKRRRPNQDVLESLAAIGSQVGQFLERKRSEEGLRESEERFRSLFEEAPIAYHEIDTGGVIRRVNRAECRLLGLPPEAIIGRHVWEFVTPAGREASRRCAAEKP